MNYYFRCPKCGGDREFVKPSEQDSNLGCTMFLWGGLIPALLYAEHRRGRVQCTTCYHIFTQPPVPRSPFAVFAAWLIIVTYSLAIVATLMFMLPEFAAWLPDLPVISTIEDWFTYQPRVAAYLVVALLLFVPIAGWIAAGLSNAGHRRGLAKEFKLRPTLPGMKNAGPDAQDSKGDQKIATADETVSGDQSE